MQIKIFYDDQLSSLCETNGVRSVIPVTPQPGAKKLKIFISVPLVDIHCLWFTGLTPGATQRLMWAVDYDCGAHKNFPFISFMNMAGINRCAVALDNLIDDTRFRAAVNQECCTYDLTVTVALSPETGVINLTVDTIEDSFMERLTAWRDSLELPVYPYPEAAWEPVYCTWYAVHGAVTQEWTEKNAAIAADLGFKTLIIDDGWCYDNFKRVSPETMPSWYEDIGDWEISEKKFPDFDAHVKRVQAMGMKYLLWVAPHLLGLKSQLLAQYPKCATSQPPVEAHLHLDAGNYEVADKLIDKLANLVSQHNLDGLKIDFLDTVPPDINSPSGRANYRFIANLSKAIRNVCPQALIEHRQSYATPQMAAFGTQFRAGDAPFDFLLNFGRQVQVRIGMGDNIPVHADPAYWAPQDLDENVARHMISMLVGVPMLSVDLPSLPERHRQIVKYYLDFYNTHKPLLNHGHWSFGFCRSEITWAAVTNSSERIIILRDSRYLADALKDSAAATTTIILNISSETVEIENLTAVRDMVGTLLDTKIIPLGGSGVIEA